MVQNDHFYTDYVGSVHYLPPEIVRPRTGRELKAGDMWAIGVLCYQMICGRMPFSGKSRKEVLTNIVSSKAANFKLLKPKGIWMSALCRDFIGKLLCDDPAGRMTAAQAMRHEWIRGTSVSLSGFGSNVTSAATSTCSMMSVGVPSGLKLDIRTVSRSNSHFSQDFDFDSLDGIDIDDVLDAVEEKELDLLASSKQQALGKSTKLQRLQKPRNVPDDEGADEVGDGCVDAVSIRLVAS